MTGHLLIIFTTVFIDLIGFGMVIPLVGLYGRHFGATGLMLPILGCIYSLMQFLCAPLWGALSDRVGRRPVMLISLAGSTISYVLFALAPSYPMLLAARAFSGICAANIATAQASIADITTPAERSRGMGLLGAAFGIGFTLGPPLGGIASHHLGLSAPGWIAAAICGLNFCMSIFRLPETLPLHKRTTGRSLLPLHDVKHLAQVPGLIFLVTSFFLVTFAFSTMEQTFSLLFQSKFHFETSKAGYFTGFILMTSGILGAFIQGGLMKKLSQRFTEKKLLQAGLLFNALGMLIFPFCPSYVLYFLAIIPLSIGSSLINPNVSALISKSVSASEQGRTLGITQGLGSLARALGPFCGLLTFDVHYAIPYLLASLTTLTLFIASISKIKS